MAVAEFSSMAKLIKISLFGDGMVNLNKHGLEFSKSKIDSDVWTPAPIQSQTYLEFLKINELKQVGDLLVDTGEQFPNEVWGVVRTFE